MKVSTPYRWLAGLGILSTTVLLCAQAPVRQSTDGGTRPFWKCSLPAGEFLVPIDRISNVSTHEYLVQGAGRVREMVVSDDSSTIARFYYMEPASKLLNGAVGDSIQKYTEGALEKVAEFTGSEPVWKRVMKEYPHATHAHTVEYRLEDVKTLQKLFAHLEDCWTHGKGGEIQVRSDQP